MSNIIPFSAERPPKSVQSKMETLIITKAMVNAWKIPSFQRPLRINDKVRSVIEKITATEAVDGVITLGKVRNDPALYIVDGQHRIEAFKLANIDEAICDVRVCMFHNMADMADEFVQLNSSMVKMRPDDILRGLEDSTPTLRTIRKSCEYVGYDQVRRGSASPVVSMSSLLRCWNAAAYETPASSNGGLSSSGMAQSIDQHSVQNLVAFLSTAHAAWGRDPEYFRLWGNLNLSLCMWLWNKLVIDRDRSGSKRYVLLDIPKFKKCLMSVSADGEYLAWLQGRNLGDRDRSPCYSRLKSIFVRRMAEETGDRPKLPMPAWATK